MVTAAGSTETTIHCCEEEEFHLHLASPSPRACECICLPAVDLKKSAQKIFAKAKSPHPNALLNKVFSRMATRRQPVLRSG